ncbi:MAG: sigma-70 family RNA polymerase sigma factor [Clostridia bacterium]|nr:sigma-70 family RNA polymerase sigma factor [Clostridia bacterium]
MLGDRELIMILRGDPNEGLRLLTSTYGGLVFSVVRGAMPGMPERDIEECAADVFSEFYLSLSSFDPEKGSVRGYICTLAKHNALDCLRKRKTVEYGDEAIDTLCDGGASVEERFEEREEKKKLVDAVRALEEPDREIVIRKFYLKEPSKTIAKRLGMSAGNVDVRTHRALEKLRAALGKEES